MIIDTSALIVILRDEVEAKAFATAIAEADRRRLSAANYLEAAVVIDGSRNPIASRRFDDLLREAEIVIEPVTEQQAIAIFENCVHLTDLIGRFPASAWQPG